MKIIASAPGSIANLGCLFDVAAMAVNIARDFVEVKVTRESNDITIECTGFNVPSGNKNSAYYAAKAVLEKYALLGEIGVYVRVYKNIPVAKGFGSSGASAAAVVYALNSLLGGRLSLRELVACAGYGEIASAGSIHYDNVAASVYGGLVLLDLTNKEINVYRVKLPRLLINNIKIVVFIPLKYRKPSTKAMREILPKYIELKELVKQTSAATKLIHAIYNNDLKAFGEAISIGGQVEEVRSRLIPNYWDLKKACLDAGALGFNIAGAGPTTFAVIQREYADIFLRNVKKYLKHIIDEYEIKLLNIEEVGAKIEFTTT